MRLRRLATRLEASPTLAPVRRMDLRLARRLRPERRKVLFVCKMPMNWVVMEPVASALASDPRVRVTAAPVRTGSGERLLEVGELRSLVGDGIRTIGETRATFERFDLLVACDVNKAAQPRGTKRVQMFHGVAGKVPSVYDRPGRSDIELYLFINGTRQEAHIAAGLAPEKARVVGMPKLDLLVNEPDTARKRVLHDLALDGDRPVVLFAPTWSEHSALTRYGPGLVRALAAEGIQVIVKPHDQSWDARTSDLFEPLPEGVRVSLSRDVGPLMCAADALVTDHSSAAFEFLVLDRPIVRFLIPELLEHFKVSPDYAARIRAVSQGVSGVTHAAKAVKDALANPDRDGAARRKLAKEMFYAAGEATARNVDAVYRVLGLQAPLLSP